jgi:hypothetical protein
MGETEVQVMEMSEIRVLLMAVLCVFGLSLAGILAFGDSSQRCNDVAEAMSDVSISHTVSVARGFHLLFITMTDPSCW